MTRESTMKPDTLPAPPRILLVEDDPVSRAFLAAAAEALPAVVDAAADCAQARAIAADTAHELWLIDANLPDGRGADLLTTLRTKAPQTPALAHTASQQRDELDALVAAGFDEVLVKPITAQVLRGALRRALGHVAHGHALATTPARMAAGCVKLPVWDDAAALAALNGQRAHVDTLRQLFRKELPGQREAIKASLAVGDTEEAVSILHRLRASCGFVGAARLAAAVHELEGDITSATALQQFDDVAGDLLDSD